MIMLASTMQDHPLTINAIFKHGERIHHASEVATFAGDECRRATFAEVGSRAARLASALKKLGVGPGDRVATFGWNTQTHMECYLAVPCMGAVLHTLNLRLFPDQLAYIINHAEDRVIIVDGSLIPLLSRIAGELKSVKHFIVAGQGDSSLLRASLDYEGLLVDAGPDFDWPDIEERSAAAMCYTSGTTG